MSEEVTHVDFLGRPIELGDLVVSFPSQWSGTSNLAILEVKKLTKKMIKVKNKSISTHIYPKMCIKVSQEDVVFKILKDFN